MIRPKLKQAPTALFCLIALCVSLGLSACDGDSKSQSQEAGGSPEGATMTPGGSEGGEAGAMDPAGAEDGGSASAGTPEAGSPEGGEEPPPPFCPNEIMEVQSSRGITLPIPTFIGVDDRNESATWRLEVEMFGVTQPGSYSLDGSTPDNCTVCVIARYNCTQRGCAANLLATEGTVVVSELGEGGDRLTGTILEAGFKMLAGDGSLSDPSIPVCIQEQTYDTVLPALVDDVVPNYKLQNCETGLMESIYSKTADQNGLWLIATAGWCPACREHLGNIHENDLPILAQGRVKPMFVVMEDDNYGPATAEFCRAYGRRYAIDSSNFYVDPNLDLTIRNIWRYSQPDGTWGIPWNNLIEGGDSNTLLYSDNESAPSELTRLINELLSR